MTRWPVRVKVVGDPPTVAADTSRLLRRSRSTVAMALPLTVAVVAAVPLRVDVPGDRVRSRS